MACAYEKDCTAQERIGLLGREAYRPLSNPTKEGRAQVRCPGGVVEQVREGTDT